MYRRNMVCVRYVIVNTLYKLITNNSIHLNSVKVHLHADSTAQGQLLEQHKLRERHITNTRKQ
jgi:hypothetical protein